MALLLLIWALLFQVKRLPKKLDLLHLLLFATKITMVKRGLVWDVNHNGLKTPLQKEKAKKILLFK